MKLLQGETMPAPDKQMRSGGVILAAGQSKRMQWPSALLPLPGGSTLLEEQVKLLSDISCNPIVVVTGAHTLLIRERLPQLQVTWGHNERWQGGIFASLQIGLELSSAADTAGTIILPVTAAGVNAATFKALHSAATSMTKAAAIIPLFHGKRGYPLYASRPFMKKLIALDVAAHDAKLEQQLQKASDIVELSVDDHRTTIDIGTPQEWRQYLNSLSVHE